MGRPLYSRSFLTTPAVRDPEPVCEKWSHLNAFDPDSDEFFASENAVYEDFVTPQAEEDEEEERDMLVVRMGNASPITSESSLSDDQSLPLLEDDDGEPVESELEPVRVRTPVRRSFDAGSIARRPFATRVVFPMSHRPYSQRDEPLPVPAPSAPIPVPTLSRRAGAIDDRLSFSPSTPPRQTPVSHFAMSPPPTSTPRLYSWARSSSHSSSPSTGPFTNPHARASYTHLSPVFIRIRDVTV